MDKSRGTANLFFFWFIILSPILILTTVGDEGQNNAINKQEKPSLIQTITDTFSLLRERSPISSWDKVKSIINQVQINFFPPNLDFRSRDEAQSRGNVEGNGAGEKMKEAVQKSFGTSKVTVEESAKSAAKVVGEAVQKTAEKVKESASDRRESDAEL